LTYRVLFSTILAAAFFFIICNRLSALIIVLCDILPLALLAPVALLVLGTTGFAGACTGGVDDGVTGFTVTFDPSILTTVGGTERLMVPHPGDTELGLDSDDDFDDSDRPDELVPKLLATPLTGVSDLSLRESGGVAEGVDRLLRFAARPARPRPALVPVGTPDDVDSLTELNYKNRQETSLVSKGNDRPLQITILNTS
jgi:hypothetical protein